MMLGALAALFASILLTFESLTFNLSGLAMLDVFSLGFMLGGLLLYWRNRPILSGGFIALSALCKMTGLMGAVIIVAHYITRRKQPEWRGAALFVLSLCISFVLLMPLFDFAAARELNPFARMIDILAGSGGVTWGSYTPQELANANATYPWAWLLSPSGYPVITPTYGGVISPSVWILIVPSIAYMVYEFYESKRNGNRRSVALFVLIWFIVTYLLWIPIVILTDRVTYIYYFYPTVGAICVAIAIAMARLWDISSGWRRRLARAIVIVFLAIHILFFLGFTPLVESLGSLSR